MSDDLLFTREEVLGGLPDRRARRLLTAIESLCARRSATETRAGAYLGVSDAAMVGEAALWTALLAASESEAQTQAEDDGLDEIRMLAGRTRRPDSIRQIERSADLWAPMVPAGPEVRAALIRLIGSRYRFEKRHVPGIRRALGLDTEEVGQAYVRRYGEELESVYQQEMGFGERVRWGWTALEKALDGLPPFWFAFTFTLTETIGAAVLALPIALAHLGPRGALTILLTVGVVNVLTIAAVAEAMTRSGVLRQGSGFIGRVAGDLLGPAASGAASLSLAGFSFLCLVMYYRGFGSALAGCIGGPPWLWAACLLGGGLLLLARDSVRGTVASAIVVGCVNLTLIVALSAMGLAHPGHTQPAASEVVSPHTLAVVVGALLTAYMGHSSVGNVARAVLRRDPGGRSLLYGCVAAMLAAIGVYSLFTLAVLHAVPLQHLAASSGTALEPLREMTGHGVAAAGTLYATLAMGMCSLHYSLALVNLVRERLPAKARLIVELPARGGRVVLERQSRPEEAPRLGITYLGPRSGRPRFRVDALVDGAPYTAETELTGRWSGEELIAQAPSLKGRLPWSIEVVEGDASGARLLVEGSFRTRYEGEAAGTLLAGVFTLAEPDWALIRAALIRGELGLEDAAAVLPGERGSAWTRLEALVQRGLLRRVDSGDVPRYAAVLARRKSRSLPSAIWDAVGGAGDAGQRHTATPAPPPRAAAREGGLREMLAQEPWRSLAAYAPVVAAFLIAEGLLLGQAGSFVGLVGFMGVMLGPFLTGLLPLMLVLAARKRGEVVPTVAWRPLGTPAVAWGVGLVYYISLPFYTLEAGRHPLERVGALIAAVLVPILTVTLLRRGAFSPRAVVELREDLRAGSPSEVRTLIGGEPAASVVRLDLGAAPVEATGDVVAVPRFSDLRGVGVTVPASPARELRIWSRRITPDGESEALPAVAEVEVGGVIHCLDLGLTEGFGSVPLDGGPAVVRIEPAAGKDAG
jgi:hypothetical protein